MRVAMMTDLFPESTPLTAALEQDFLDRQWRWGKMPRWCGVIYGAFIFNAEGSYTVGQLAGFVPGLDDASYKISWLITEWIDDGLIERYLATTPEGNLANFYRLTGVRDT